MDPQFRAELERRRNLVRSLLHRGSDDSKGDILVLFAAPVHFRNSDVEHSYRQHSDFYYLTGFEEPGAALALSVDDPGYALFVRPRNRERETWEGRRVGVERAPEMLAAEVAYDSDELDDKLADLFEDRSRVHFLLGESEAWDRRVIAAINQVRSRRRKKVRPPTELVDARLILHSLRQTKSDWEKDKMAEVCSLTAKAHEEAMRACRPGMMEWELQDVVESAFRKAGARRVAYDSIVGSGENATILHYRENNRAMEEGDLVLIDAGAEKNYLAADITRTFPVSGRFSQVQARVYQYVLDAQIAAIEACRPGASMDDVHEAARLKIAEGLIKEGLLETDADEETRTDCIKRFFMHRTSHFLGMDVHDVGHPLDSSLPLGPGSVITVEPGLYFAPDDETVSEELRGIGIRIEDDVLITEGSPSVLTEGAPKTIEDIERVCAR